MKHPIKISPSLLSADFANLENDIKACERGGADMLHVDVMDGHFVPNLTIGPFVVDAIRRVTKLPISCHLMITDPYKYIPDFATAGCNMISVHVEGAYHLHRTLSLIHKYDLKAGIAINPATPMDFAYDAAEYCDYILLMSVNPGFGGQSFIPSFLKRAELVRKFLITKGLKDVELEVDGGVKASNVKSIVKAGANILVAGSGIFDGNIEENIRQLRQLSEE